jgi:hypothetical protein
MGMNPTAAQVNFWEQEQHARLKSERKINSSNWTEQRQKNRQGKIKTEQQRADFLRSSTRMEWKTNSTDRLQQMIFSLQFKAQTVLPHSFNY